MSFKLNGIIKEAEKLKKLIASEQMRKVLKRTNS
jgi:hypothetical protein